MSALRKVQREDGMGFAVIRNFGLRRLTDAEKVPYSGRTIISAQRKILRGERELKTVNVGELSDSERAGFYIQSAKFGAIKLSLSNRVQSRIIQRIETNRGPLSMGELEKLFGGVKSKLNIVENVKRRTA